MKHYKNKIAKLKKDSKQKYDKTKNSNKKTINGNIRNKNNWVVKLSNKNLSEDERKVLLLGLNFSVSQGYVSKTEILANIEKDIKNLPDNTTSIIRSKVVDVLDKKHKNIPNLSIKEKKALKNLRDDTNIVITKADKGNCTVIIDKDKYEEKIFKLLNDKDTYVILKNDLKKNIERKLNKFIFELYKIDSLSQKEYFYLRSTDAIAPRIYGLPKIHKPDWPLRPIVSFINSLLYNLSQFVAKILTPLINSNNLSIKNSFELIDRISNCKINDNDLMLSFDVVSLFTKIPVNIAKSVIFDRLKCDSELKIRCKLNINKIMNALDLCLDNTYLCFRKKFYCQIFGVAMCSPISVIVANLIMDFIENKMLKDFASPPRIFVTLH